jgi:hypothetical protein
MLRRLALACVVLALAMRITVPSGWMPSSERGFALTVCTGMDTQTVWLDAKGKLHKEDPSKGKSVEHSPCAFAGATAANDLPVADLHFAMPHRPAPLPIFAVSEVLVGKGLAAPPPPATGPPSIV